MSADDGTQTIEVLKVRYLIKLYDIFFTKFYCAFYTICR